MGGFPDLSKLPVAQKEESEIFTTHLGLLYLNRPFAKVKKSGMSF